MLIIATALAGVLIALTAAVYFKRRGSRSDQERRAKKLARFLAGDTAAGGTGGTGSNDGAFDGND